MKLWILSDIHCELTTGWDIPGPGGQPDFDVLVMAGDLKPMMERGVEWLRERVSKPVVYIAGNHESYRADIDRTLEKAKSDAIGSNVSVLENETLIIAGVRFVAATLWTDFDLFANRDAAMRAAGANMNDYRMIRTSSYTRQLKPLDTLKRHIASREYIDDELAQEFNGPTVVVTHHAPYAGAMKRGHESDILSAAYCSDLSELILRRQPDAWIYGHTHQSDDIMMGRTRIVSNAKGYGPHPSMGLRVWENADFDPQFTIDINS